MKLIQKTLLAVIFSFLSLLTNANSEKLLILSEFDLKKKFENLKDNKINSLTNSISKDFSNFANEHFKRLKYLDFNINTQEHLKPTFNIMTVSEIKKLNAGTIFNQTSINTHDDDETINIGFGLRKLIKDDLILLGSSIFYDHQLNQSHQRVGAGVEAISSIFDLRGNYYNGISGTKTLDEGTERALDGWDLQMDYHLPVKSDVSLFINAFEFKNPEKDSTYRERGNKMGTSATLGNFVIEAGYMDDNQESDAYFGTIKLVLKTGEGKDKSKTDYYAISNLDKPTTDQKMKNSYIKGKSSKGDYSWQSVRDKLYNPVKRENKIRLVKIDAAGVVMGGF